MLQCPLERERATERERERDSAHKIVLSYLLMLKIFRVQAFF